MKLILEVVVIVFASFNLLLSWFVVFRLHQPTTIFNWMIKVFISAFSPILFLVGLLSFIIGLILNSVPAMAIGSLSSLPYLIYIVRTSRPPDSTTGFEKVFGTQWQDRISP